MTITVVQMKFYWVDVFAENKLQGNQLAVFTDVEGLTDEEMQTIAKEMNLSETTFVSPVDAQDKEHMVFQTRIFTVDEELPFAGHPTLGTAFVMRKIHSLDKVNLGLKVGNIPVTFEKRNGGVFGEMLQNDPVFGSRHDPNKIAEILDISVRDIDADLPIETVSTGNPFIIVPFRNLEILENIRPNYAKMEDYLKSSGAKFMYFVTRDTRDSGAILRSRLIFYGGEDPATGSAAGPATAWLLKYGVLEPEKLSWIQQGVEMKRPSRIFVRGTLDEDKPRMIRVGGQCFIIAEGEFNLH